MPETNVKINVGYNIDKSGLDSLRESLKQLSNFTKQAFDSVNAGKSFKDANYELIKIKAVASTVGEALDRAFNPKLGTINIQAFEKELKRTHTTVDEIYQSFSKAGSAGQAAFQKLVSSTLSVNKEVQKTKTLLDKMGETLSNTIKWNLASGAINKITGAAQEAYGYVKSLDTSLNNIRIVTNKSAEDMDKFAEKANKAAKALGATTTDYTDAALTFYQQGLSDTEAQARADLTLKVANASGLNADDAAEYVTAVLNGYKVGSEEAEKAMDVLARVGADTASSLDELSEAMSKTASTANTMGMTEEQLAAALATTIQVTRQDASSVGTSYKTILMRISDIAAGTEDAEATLGQYTGQMAKMGINVLDNTGKLRDMGSVIEEVGDGWANMSREQQIALARTMAGTRQANNLLALFDNWDTYKETLESANNAEGTLQEQQDIYMESTRAHLDQLTASAEDFYDSFLDSKTINNFADSLGWVLDRLASITDALGGGKGALLALGSTAMRVFNQQIGKSIGSLYSRITDTKDQTKAIETQLRLAAEFKNVDDPDIQAMASRRESRIKYGSIMSDETKQSYDAGLAQYEQAIASQANVAKARQEAMANLKVMGDATGLDTSGLDAVFTADIDTAGELSEAINEIFKSYEKLGEEGSEDIKKVQTMMDSLFKKTDELNKLLLKTGNATEDSAIIDSLDAEIKKLQTDLKGIFSTPESGNSFITNLKQYADTLPQTDSKTKAFKDSIEELEKAMSDGFDDTEAQREAVAKLGKAYAETTTQAKEMREKTDNALTAGSKENGEEADRARKIAEDFLNGQDKALELTKKLSEITKFIGALGQLVSVLQSVSDIVNILNDDTLDSGEKAEQVIERLVIAIPMLISGITAIIPALQSLSGAAQATLASIAATPIGPFLIALTAITAILPTAISLFNKFHMSAEDAKQQIDELNNSMQSFKSTTDTYNNNVQSLEDMKDAYDELSKKAGTYDEHIDRLTASEREQYNSMKNQLVELNGDLLAYYNDQGEAILKNNDGIQSTIDLLKEQYKLEQQKLYTENQEETINAFDTQYQNAVSNAKNSNSSTRDTTNPLADLTYIDKAKEAGNKIAVTMSQVKDASNEVRQATSEIISSVYKSGDDFYTAITDSKFNDAVQVLKENGYAEDALNELVKNISVLSERKEMDRIEQEAADAGVEAASKIDSAWLMGVATVDPTKNANYLKLQENLTKNNLSENLLDSVISSYTQGLRLSEDEGTADLIAKVQNFNNTLNSLLFDSDGNTTEFFEDAKKSKEIVEKQVVGTYNDYIENLSNGIQDVLNNSEFKNLAKSNSEAAAEIIKGMFPDISQITFDESGNATIVDQYQEKIRGLAEQINIKNNNRGNTNAIENSLANIFTTDDLNNLDSIINKFNELYSGTGSWSEALEKARATIESTNNIVNSSTIGELIANTKEAITSGADIGSSYTDKLVELGKQYNNTSDEISAFERALTTDNETLKNHTETMLQLATAAGELAEETGYSADELESYGRQFAKMDGIEADSGDTLAELAKEQLRYDDAVTATLDNVDDWTAAIKDASDGSLLAADVANELREAYSNLLDIDGSFLPEEFLKSAENLQLMQDAINGSEEAYESLRQKATDEFLISVGLDPAGVEEFNSDLASFLSDHDWDSITVGTNLDESGITAGLEQMINNIGLNVDQARALLDLLNVDAEVNTATDEVKVNKTYTGVTPVFESIPSPYPENNLMYGIASTPSATSVKYDPTFTEVEDVTPAVGTGVKITNATKTGGGKVKFQNSSPIKSSNKTSGGGGKKSNSGSTKASTPKTKNLNQDKLDRYHDINIKINGLSKSYERLQKVQDKLTGKELIENLNKQLAILEKQRDAYKQKIQLAKQEAAEIRNSLAGYGASFDANGEISNYAALMVQAQKNLNDVIGWYNGLSADAQDDAADKKVDAAQEEYDKIKELVTDYDKLINDTIPDLEDQITEALLSEIEIKIQEFDMEVKLRLDMGEAMRDWNEFKRKVIDDLNSDSLLGDALQNQADILSYYNTANTGIGSIQSLTNKIGNAATPGSILGELQKMQNGGHSSIYSAYDASTGTWVDDVSGAVDDLKESYKELMTELENLEDLEQNVTDAFLSSIDAVNDALDKNKEAFELMSDQISHDITMIQKLYGEDAYEQMDSYYEKQLTNIQAELAAQQNAATYWKQLADAERAAIVNGTGNKDALEKYEENWKNTVSNVNSLVENWAEALTTKYENTIDALVKSLNNKISNNKGLDYLDEQLNLLSSNADNYLDTINAAYAKQQLQNKWQDAINNTDSVNIQRKLNDLMQQQMDMLEKKGQLTQYDIDRAEKEYEIALKQIALQEAQQNKSKMRLKRDANGNYSYQFVSDEDAVRQAQQELADAQNSLYNFDKDAYKNNLNDMYSTWNEFQEKVAQAYKDYADDQDALQEHIALLQEQYGEKINYLTEQNLSIRGNLTESAFNDLANLYNVDVSNFQNMTQEEQDLIMNGLVPEWDSGVQQMIDKFSGEGGFEQVCQETFDKLGEAAQDYIKNLEDIGQTNNKISNEAYEQNQKLLEESNQLIDSARQEYQAIGDIVSQVNDLIASYRTAKTEAIAATKAAFEFVQAKNAQDAARAAEEQRKNQEAATAAAKANAASSNSSSSSSGGGTGSGSEKDGVASVGDTVGYNGKYYYDSNGKAPAGSKYAGVADGVVIDKMNENAYGVHIHSADGKYGDLGWVKKSQLFGYDTGGYTGSWGADGRLALLHQKELVLNKEDTENMLSAVKILRTIVAGIGENVINNTSYLLSNIGSRVNIPDSGDTLEQTVYINAKFEGQTEANEIETALRNLVNTASQRAYRNKK